MTPTQCLQARKLLAWTRVDLAREVSCSSETIKNFEEQRRTTSISVLTGLQRAFEAAGVEFLVADQEELGMRLRSPAG